MGTNPRSIIKTESRLKMASSDTIKNINLELNLACDLTRQIIALASQMELSDLETLNNQRLSLIESIFSSDKSKINVTKSKQLFELNLQAMDVIKQQMALTIQQQQKFRKGNTAHNAYMEYCC